MSDAVQAAGRTARQLSAQVRKAAELADQLAVADLAQADDPGDATAAARRLLADARDAIESAQARAEQLDAALAQAGRMLPFLTEGWPSRRAWLQQAIEADPQDGLASWLTDWFAAASGHRVNALRRLGSDVVLPPGADVIRERMLAATDALADDDWPRCRQVLRAGADGIDLGPRQVPDLPAGGHFEPDGTVREGLRLLAARLALHHGQADDASAILDGSGPWRHPAARDALRAAAARLRSRDGTPGDKGSDSAAALLAEARESDPIDLDVTAETITQARQRADGISALDSARAAIRARPALYDASDDVGRLVAPPAELWIALAERAADEEDTHSAWPFLDRAADATEPGDYETSAVTWELRADLAAPVTGEGRTVHAVARQAYFYAGRARTSAGQLELARQDYEAAAGGEVASSTDDRIRALARLSLADVIAQISWQRLSQVPEADLRRALELLESGRKVADVDSREPWSYLTEADLRAQLSRVPGATDRREQEWAALRAAATAASRVPGWVATWLAVADAAMTCDLYWVAEAAAAQADEIAEATGTDRDAARAGYIRALVNTGQYEKAGGKLDQGNGADPWYRCMYGLIALRQGDADAAVMHFPDAAAIAPTWYWAWHSRICALALAKGIDDAQQASADLMRATAALVGERPRLYAAAFDALLRREPDEALRYADELAKATGPDDPGALRARGEAMIAGKDKAGWSLIAQSLDRDPRPASVDEWENEDRRVLALLTGNEDTGPQSARQLDAARNAHARKHPSDPGTELRQAVKEAPCIEYATQAGDLTRTIVLAGREWASAASQPAEPTSEPQAASPTVVLRLPAAWFTRDSAAVGKAGHAPGLRERHRGLQDLLRDAGPEPQLVVADELAPDGYQILVDGRLRASGHIEPELRYCPREAMSLLPEHVRTNPRVVATDHGIGMPSGLLHSERGLGDLLTWSAGEIIAAKYHDVAGEYRHQPRPARKRAALEFLPPYRFSSLEPRQLSHRLWRLISRPDDKANWHTAQRVRDDVTQEPAYFRWINRRQPLWDSLTDWYGAQRELDAGHFLPPDDILDEELRRKAIEEAAYFRWINRGQSPGDPLADWHAAERELGAG